MKKRGGVICLSGRLTMVPSDRRTVCPFALHLKSQQVPLPLKNRGTNHGFIYNYFLQLFSVCPIITISSTKKNAKNSGISLKLIPFAITPNSGGIKVEPT